MKPSEQLLRLLRIQELAIETRSANGVVEGAPARIEEIEDVFRQRNAEYVAIRDRADELEKDRAARDLELAELEESKKKFSESLMQVKNQREYAAVLKEIDTVKARIGEHEEAILKAMEELETLKADLETRSAHIEKEREIVDQQRREVEGEVARSREAIERCEAERARVESELPTALVESVRRIEENRGGIFLVRADNELCTACHVRVRPQVYQEIKLAAEIHACGSCRRFLYYEPVLRPSSGEADARPDSTMEAMNGGTA